MKRELPFLVLLLLAASAHAQSAERDPRLSGVARDPSGRPVAGAEIEVFPDLSLIATNEFWRRAPLPSIPMYRGRTDADGRFTIAAESGRVYEVRARKDGFQTSKVQAIVGRPVVVAMTPGREDEGAIEAGSGPKVSGTIADPEGKPVAGAVVRRPWDFSVLARSAADGSYSVTFGEDDAVLMVFHPGSRVGVIHKPGGKPGAGDVVLEPGYEVTGRLLDEAGRPVVGTRILIDSDIMVAENHSYSGVAWSAMTDISGRFVFRELAPNGRYFVRTILVDGTPLEFGQGWAKQPARDLGTQRTGPQTAVTGIVKGKDGKAIEFGFVRVLRLYDEPLSHWFVAREAPAYPIAKGRYRIPGLCAGRYELGFMVENAEPEVRQLTAGPKAGTERVDVEIGAGRSFEGKVVDGDGKPIAGALLRGLQFGARDAAPLVPPGMPDHNGRFLVGNVRVLTREDGTYRLERVRSYVPTRLVVIKEGFRTRTVRVEVGGQPPAEIVLEGR